MLPPFRISLKLILLLIMATLNACSSSSSGDDAQIPSAGNVRFSGQLRALETTGQEMNVSGTTICAINVCAASDEQGGWSLLVPAGNYQGGTVVFDINDPTIQQQVEVSGLDREARDIVINFTVQPNGAIEPAIISQDVPDLSAPPGIEEPVSTPQPSPGPLSNDPQTRACQILQRSNITITDVRSPINQGPGDPCPRNVQTLIAVGNINPITFDYEVLVDVPDIVIAPETGTASQGTLNRHDGSYLCSSQASFVANVTAQVVRYIPSTGDPITREEAITLCGANAHVGNTSDTRQITVNITP